MKSEQVILKKDHLFEKCPKCGASGKLRRSKPKNLFERSWKLGIWGYYRCRECGWRGRKLSIGMRKVSFKSIVFYLLLMLATAFIVKMVVQRFAMN